MPDTAKFTEALEVWKRHAIAIFALLSLLIAMLVALVVELGGVIEVIRFTFSAEKVQMNLSNHNNNGTSCTCSCKADHERPK